MILPFETYDPAWKLAFEDIKDQLSRLLSPLEPRIDHIGSTAVEGLSAKPIIDVLVGVRDQSSLDRVPVLLSGDHYVYYEKYNTEMPYRRFFLLLRDRPDKLGLPSYIGPTDEIPARLHDYVWRQAHIHVIPISSVHWLRHIAFRDYLRAHPEVVKAYQALKEKLVKLPWEDGNDYNAAKDAFLKVEESKALDWYHANGKGK
ncbi:MAG TPA: GrpB family protein [Sphingobacterium sp.]|nr:GrpB family protein [Sphingobacterium sp.]